MTKYESDLVINSYEASCQSIQWLEKERIKRKKLKREWMKMTQFKLIIIDLNREIVGLPKQ